jgi:rRNA maturation endonuclease Nob1
MIAGVCIACSRVEQQFRKDAAFCQRCGKKLTKVSIYQNSVDGVDGPVVAQVLEGEE